MQHVMESFELYAKARTEPLEKKLGEQHNLIKLQENELARVKEENQKLREILKTHGLKHT